MEKLKNLGCINGRPERAAVFMLRAVCAAAGARQNAFLTPI